MATLPASLKLFSSRTHLFTLAKHLLPFPTTTTTTIAAAATTIKPVLDHPPPHFPSWTHQHGLLSQVPQVIGGEGKEGKVAAIVETRGWVDDDDGFSDEHEGGGMSNIDVVEWDESEDHEDDDEEEDDDDFDFDEDDVNVGDDQKKKLK